jgi:hypothetical protein
MLKPAFAGGLFVGLFASLAAIGAAFMGPLGGKVDLLWFVPAMCGSAAGLFFALKSAKRGPRFVAGLLVGALSAPFVAAACELVVWVLVGLK